MMSLIRTGSGAGRRSRRGGRSGSDLLRNPEGGELGQGMVEYALILVLVAIVVIVVLTKLGGAISDVFQNVINHLQ